jgi:riboflavin kinase/FMN adenylyltransferase
VTDGKRVAIIGVFDGVHRGHQAVIAQARALAGAGEVFALTFDPHPLVVLAPEAMPDMLMSIDDRVKALTGAGVDSVVIVPFTEELSGQTPREFIEEFVIGRAGADVVVVGENFRFGRGASGDIQTLRELGHDFGFDVRPLELRGDGGRFSSTRVRTALAEGNLAAAMDVLGRPFGYRGVVVHGDHRGRTLGVPTANIGVPQGRAAPADGVYAGFVRRNDGTQLPAAISVGDNPQYAGTQRRIEAHVIDQDDLDLYGEVIEVGFVQRLRGQEVFDSEGAFIAQMQRDIDQARTLLS